MIEAAIGLEAHAQVPPEPQRVSEARDYLAFRGHQDQVLVPHEFADGSRHFWEESACQGTHDSVIGFVAQQPVPKLAHGEGGDRRKRLFIMRVEKQSGDFVALVGDDRMPQEFRERDVREDVLRRYPFLGA